MLPELSALYQDLNLEKLRIARPSKFVFLCGGTIRSDKSKKADSLRDYLYRIRSLGTRLRGEVVLAETATQLYRDTTYSDLISFEEDIARVAAIVLVIAESPGSLAELGAFASNNTIRKTLRIIMEQRYSTAESFIRFGPVEKLKKEGDDFVGFYPWRTNNSGNVVLTSVAPHHFEIVKFINKHLDAAPRTELFSKNPDAILFYLIYWVVYLSLAISTASLYTLVQLLFPGATPREIKNKVYCMKIAGWVASEDYSGKTYFFACHDRDPLNIASKITLRKKIASGERPLSLRP